MELTVASLGGDRHRIMVRGHEIVVDQPVESGGEDAGPTPTDLFVASLASCVAHYARRGLGAGGEGPTVRCTWRMSETPPWRVAAIAIDVTLPASYHRRPPRGGAPGDQPLHRPQLAGITARHHRSRRSRAGPRHRLTLTRALHPTTTQPVARMRSTHQIVQLR